MDKTEVVETARESFRRVVSHGWAPIFTEEVQGFAFRKARLLFALLYTAHVHFDSLTGHAVRFLRPALSRVRRCHPFTWCVVLVVGAAMVLIVVPGDEVGHFRAAHPGPFGTWASSQVGQVAQEVNGKQLADKEGIKYSHPWLYIHGWPRPYLIRALADDLNDPRGDGSSKALIRYVSGETVGGTIYGFVSWSNYDNWPIVFDASQGTFSRASIPPKSRPSNS